MALLRIDLDNILCFNEFSATFSYPKKLVNSPLEGEYLSKYPKIRYRKVNVLVGSNASGKTSLGRAIWNTFLFLKEKEAGTIYRIVSSPNKGFSVLMDCVFENGLFFRAEIKKESPEGELMVRLRETSAKPEDTYESLLARLDETAPFVNYIIALEQFRFGGWNFSFPSIEDGFDFIHCRYGAEEKKEFCAVFKDILVTMDPTIVDVYPSAEIPDSYIVRFRDGDAVAITNGERLSSVRRLSSGTKYAVNVAGVIHSIKKHRNGFYFVDEQFSYVNSEIEIACLSKMIALLNDGEQLFFTSHNTELLKLPLPNHSFNFLRKEEREDGYRILWTNAASLEKRNNVSIKNLYDNDFFGASPNVERILKLAEE